MRSSTAALDLVGELGYAKLTIEGIAARPESASRRSTAGGRRRARCCFDAFLTLGEDARRRDAALPDTGDLEADLKLVLRATVAELTDPRYDPPMRALHTEIVHDPALAADYAKRLDEPLRQGKLARLRSAQRSGDPGRSRSRARRRPDLGTAAAPLAAPDRAADARVRRRGGQSFALRAAIAAVTPAPRGIVPVSGASD